MYEQIIAWGGLALLLLLCLPFAVVQKLVLHVYGWGLRLALLALLGFAAYLWFRPEQMPVEVTDALGGFPWLMALLPEPGTPYFGISAAAVVVAMLLPLLMVIDVCRKLAGRPRDRRVPGVGPEAEEPMRPAHQRVPSLPRRIGRRDAADTMAEAAASHPSHLTSPLDQSH
jgi:hypothetical protein